MATAVLAGPPPKAVPALAPAAGQAPAANTAAVCTLAAPSGSAGPPDSRGSWNLAAVHWSYGPGTLASTAGFTIAWTDPVAGAVSEFYAVTNTGPGELNFIPAKRFPVGAAVTITLAAGGSGVPGTIYATAWTE